MWIDQNYFLRWREEMLLVTLRRLVRNRTISVAGQILAMRQAAWHILKQHATYARYHRAGFRMLTQVASCLEARARNRQLRTRIQRWHRIVEFTKRGERSITTIVAAYCRRTQKFQVQVLLRNSWRSWYNATLTQRMISTGFIFLRKIVVAQKKLGAHEKFLYCWNAWVKRLVFFSMFDFVTAISDFVFPPYQSHGIQRTIFIRSRADLKNVAANNMITRRFVSIRSLGQRYLPGKFKLFAFGRWRNFSSAQGLRLQAARAIFRYARRFYRFSNKYFAQKMWVRWWKYVTLHRSFDDGARRIFNVAVFREKIYDEMKFMHQVWSRWWSNCIRLRHKEIAIKCLWKWAVKVDRRWESDRIGTSWRIWAAFAYKHRRCIYLLNAAISHQFMFNMKTAWSALRSWGRGQTMRHAACRLGHFTIRRIIRERLQRAWWSWVSKISLIEEESKKRGQNERDQRIACQALRQVCCLNVQRRMAASLRTWSVIVTEWRDEEYLYHMLLARLVHRISVVHQVIPCRRTWQRWVLHTAHVRQQELNQQVYSVQKQLRDDIAMRLRGGALYIARLTGIRSALCGIDVKLAFFRWNHFGARHNSRLTLGWIKIENIYKTRRFSMLISAITRWKWLLGQRERRTESMVWVPRRNKNRVNVESLSKVVQNAYPKPPKAATAYTAYTHLLYGISPATSPSKQTSPHSQPGVLSPIEGEEIMLMTLRQPPPPPGGTMNSYYDNSTSIPTD